MRHRNMFYCAIANYGMGSSISEVVKLIPRPIGKRRRAEVTSPNVNIVTKDKSFVLTLCDGSPSVFLPSA